MKRLTLVLLLVVLSACAKGGAEIASARIVGQCQDLFAVNWHPKSRTNLEVHSFTPLTLNNPSSSLYTWVQEIGSTSVPGSACTISAKVYDSDITSRAAGFNYVMEFSSTDADPGCDKYQDGVNHGTVYIKHDCDRVTVCTSANLSGNCNELF